VTEIECEFNRLATVYQRIGRTLSRQPPATLTQIDSILSITGVDLDENLKALWQISNGSNGKMWLAEGDDFTPYYFLSVDDVLESWQMFAPYESSVYEEWYDDESWGDRDPRIQRHFLRHKHWVSFVEFNGGSHQLIFDADPTLDGVKGQIINYIHDPDGVFWVAHSFLDFFKASNDTLEEWLEYPVALRDQLWLYD
jgi:cell wall assembly regulator SMI1